LQKYAATLVKLDYLAKSGQGFQDLQSFSALNSFYLFTLTVALPLHASEVSRNTMRTPTPHVFLHVALSPNLLPPTLRLHGLHGHHVVKTQVINTAGAAAMSTRCIMVVEGWDEEAVVAGGGGGVVVGVSREASKDLRCVKSWSG
jgi:hypothetical protein